MSATSQVVYAVVEGREGKALVAARDGKVVASFLPGTSPWGLVKRLRSRFPGAIEAPAGEVPGAEALRRWLDGDASTLGSVAVDLGGLPPFASKVYGRLRRVPPGSTLTYGELAKQAGSPGAARAVGRAMATNPLAPFVPCHRVVGSDGGLRGFSAPGGLKQKARFLATEARANP